MCCYVLLLYAAAMCCCYVLLLGAAAMCCCYVLLLGAAAMCCYILLLLLLLLYMLLLSYMRPQPVRCKRDNVLQSIFSLCVILCFENTKSILLAEIFSDSGWMWGTMCAATLPHALIAPPRGL